jgi:primosomal protein N''
MQDGKTIEERKCDILGEKIGALELEARSCQRRHAALLNPGAERSQERYGSFRSEAERVEEAGQVLTRLRELNDSLIPQAKQDLQRARACAQNKFKEVHRGEYEQCVANAGEALVLLVRESDAERAQRENFLAEVGASAGHPAVRTAVGDHMDFSDRIEELIDRVPALRKARERERRAQIEHAVESLKADYAERAVALAEAFLLLAKAEQAERENNMLFRKAGVDELPATCEPEAALLISECLQAAVDLGLLPSDVLPVNAREETAV